jgi:hypothetical protein
MAVYRITRKLFNSPVSISSIQQTNKQSTPGVSNNSSNKPGVLPNSPISQQKELNDAKRMNHQMQIERSRVQRQNMILQKSRYEMSEKSKQNREKEIREAQKIEETKANNQNKLQVSLNNNRPDQGKVMPANLVKGKTVPTDTKSVN